MKSTIRQTDPILKFSKRCGRMAVGLLAMGCLLGAKSAAAETLTLDASALPPAAQAEGFHLGAATSPDGHTLNVNSRGLVRDGQPWVGMAGEFHFSRCPESAWRDELLKMKAGGVRIVSTYIFWIHHEEVEGTWDWTGQRNLRKFLETCREVGLDALLRVGPWCHGEARNGGFPDWLQQKGDDKEFELRRDNPAYLAYVRAWYEQINQQAKDLLWKDGGPVVGIQLENEFSGPTAHLMTLKQLARDTGLDAPLYTCTGWGAGGSAPFGEMLPMAGAYAEGFWDRSLTKMPGGYARSFQFSGSRRAGAAAMGAVGGDGPTPAASPSPEPARAGVYPFFTCELGAGMMSSYHRRILTYPADAESIALVKLGSGVNLLGFYMYHGGRNPDGRLTYLNETQATRYWNDLPVKDYDFQAPLGALGQERKHYHWLRLLGLFLDDFGPGLSGMTSRAGSAPGGLGWAVRSDGSGGYIFVNNYVRLTPQPARENVQFQIKFAGGEIKVPSEPVTVPDNCRFFWPVNLDLGGVKLISATAQPICRVDDGNTRYTVFKQTAGVPAEFIFDGTNIMADAFTGTQTNDKANIHLHGVRPGLGAAVRLHMREGKSHVIILLDEATALNLWKGQWEGRERLFLTHANLLFDGSVLRLRAEDPADFSIGILPAPKTLTDGRVDLAATDDGLFRLFAPQVTTAAPLRAVVESAQAAGPARPVPLAPPVSSRRQGMAMQPEDADFAQAAVWRVKIAGENIPTRDFRLRVRYTGDVLRAYAGDKLLGDDFYAGQPYEIELPAAAYHDGIMLKILPLREDAPIYFSDRAALKFGDAHTALALEGVDVVETHEVRLAAGK